ncbi:MAG: hypothetical protein DRN08_03885 [Thermoplasmata archaeon]|nr:MAG: hypothetical protein DRN08_03885 [Thermoplasmata archaeon]
MDNKISLVVVLCCIIMFLSLNIVVASETPVVESISYSPENPSPGATLTFNATITGSNISSVYLIVEECKGDFCFADKQNITMNATDNDMYQTEVTLKHEDATTVRYYLIIKSNNIWYEDTPHEFDLSEKTTPNGNDTTGDTSFNTPGFELILLITATISVLLYSTMRKKEK